MAALAEKATVLVTDAGRGSAIASIRALARDGYRVIAADADPAAPGFVSRFTSARVLYPQPTLGAKPFVDCLADAIERHRIDLVLPVTDPVMFAMEAHRERFESICRVPWIDAHAARQVRQKDLTFALADRVGVPYPATRQVETTEQAIAVAQELSWPIVLKPASSHTIDGKQTRNWTVHYAFNLDELRKTMAEFEGHCDVLLQEYFDGSGIGVEVLADRGDILCAFQHRRLREVPLTGGVSSFRCSEPIDPILFDQTRRLIADLRWTGLAMAEFKVDAAGECRLMEINGRIWGSLPLAIAAGVNFPGQLCKLILEGADATPKNPVALDSPRAGIPGQPPYRVGLRVHHLQKEISWIVRVLKGAPSHPVKKLPRRIDALVAILQLFNPRCKFDILSLSDRRPGLRLIRNLLLGNKRRLPSQVTFEDQVAKVSVGESSVAKQDACDGPAQLMVKDD